MGRGTVDACSGHRRLCGALDGDASVSLTARRRKGLRIQLKGPTTAGLMYSDSGGDGQVVVLLHGVLMNGSLWDGVVDGLRDHCRCIVPELPFGAHRTPMPDDADLERQRPGPVSQQRTGEQFVFDSVAGRPLEAPAFECADVVGTLRRRGRDSNPRRASNPYSLSRGALSATQPPLR